MCLWPKCSSSGIRIHWAWWRPNDCTVSCVDLSRVTDQYTGTSVLFSFFPLSPSLDAGGWRLTFEGNLHLEFYFWFWFEWRVLVHAPVANWTQNLEFWGFGRDAGQRSEARLGRQRPAVKANGTESNSRLFVRFPSDWKNEATLFVSCFKNEFRMNWPNWCFYSVATWRTLTTVVYFYFFVSSCFKLEVFGLAQTRERGPLVFIHSTAVKDFLLFPGKHKRFIQTALDGSSGEPEFWKRKKKEREWRDGLWRDPRSSRTLPPR